MAVAVENRQPGTMADVRTNPAEHDVLARNANTFIIGSRNSKLAMVQSEEVKRMLQEKFPELDVRIVSMTTLGDRVLTQPLYTFGGKSLWTKDLEVAMLNGSVDAIVHSLKDLPTEFPEGCAMGGVPAREDPTDSLVVRRDLPYKSLDDLPDGAVVGTSSVRRVAQLRHFYPKLHFADMRGNLHTRIRKLDEDESIYSALILATAGLNRLDLNDRITSILEPPTLHYAVGQGALGIEIRDGDHRVKGIIQKINCFETCLRTTAERALLHALEGGCSVPVGCRTVVEKSGKGYNLHLTGTVTSPVCARHVVHSNDMYVENEDDAFRLGMVVASELVKLGARDILEELGRHVAEMKIVNHDVHIAPHPLPPNVDPSICLRPQGW